VVVTGTTPYDVKGLLKSAIRDANPVLFLPHKKLSGQKGQVPDEEYTLPLGESVVESDGEDVTVVATQLMFHRTSEAAAELDDISVEIVNPRTFAPLDMDPIYKSVQKTGRLVVVDETVLRYGTQGHIISEVTENFFFSLDAPPNKVGIRNSPIPFCPPLEKEVLPSTERIMEAIQGVF
jgi:pyruvate dehydrogenase E1 component beta subunit